jgi:molybdopterin synthase catalytic subunit/molybdopterin converting factor small subunit
VLVRVRLFAGLRERAGREELELELPDGACVADALAQVEHLAPGVPLVLAVNREYAAPDFLLAPGDELAVVPPVSGGAPVHAVVRAEPLVLDALAALVADPRAGAVVTFSGTTRDVEFLDYEAYAEMAQPRMAAIVEEAIARHGLCAAAAEHRIGRVPRSAASVIVAASAPHRGEAFTGAREIIDRIKAEAPIWKKEEGAWVQGTVPEPPAASSNAATTPVPPDAPAASAHQILDVALDVRLDHDARVLVVNGRAESPARVGWLGGRFHQLRLEEPLAAERGTRLEVRALRTDELLGEAVVLDPDAPRHGPTNDALVRLLGLERGEAVGADGTVAPPPLDAAALALEQRYRAAGSAGLADAVLTDAERAALFALREVGRVARPVPGTHAHVDFAP